MARMVNREKLIAHKWKGIASWNTLNDNLIKSSELKTQSKSDKLSFWIETFSKYQADEASFNPFWRPNYQRGDIIKVDFGFNVGREYGGLHYAVVISKHIARSADTLTVIPLTSKKDKPVHRNDVDLGEEIYEKLYTKYLQAFNDAAREAAKNISIEPTDDNKLLISLHIDEKEMNKLWDEISKMKKGSIALISQITTISKMRIHNPKNTTDTLYGVRLSTDALNKVNEKMKNLFIFG